MNKIKSLFIGIFPMFAMAVSGYAIYQLVTVGMDYIWLGALLITLPTMLFFGRVMMFKNMARTTAHFPVLTILACAGLALSVYGYMQLPEETEVTVLNQAAILLSGTSFVLFILYNFWYSSLGRGSHGSLQVGNLLPYFKVTATNENVVDSNVFKGKPAIIIFFRGNWCPLCMAQIKEISASYRELSKYGVKIALISPQPEKNTQSLADKFDTPFTFLTDVGNRAAQDLGIAMENGLPAGMEMLGYDKDTVYPTVIITDAIPRTPTGKILKTELRETYN